MENTELYRMLEIPDEVEKQLMDYGRSRNVPIQSGIINKILKRDEWDMGIKVSSRVPSDFSNLQICLGLVVSTPDFLK